MTLVIIRLTWCDTTVSQAATAAFTTNDVRQILSSQQCDHLLPPPCMHAGRVEEKICAFRVIDVGDSLWFRIGENLSTLIVQFQYLPKPFQSSVVLSLTASKIPKISEILQIENAIRNCGYKG